MNVLQVLTFLLLITTKNQFLFLKNPTVGAFNTSSFIFLTLFSFQCYNVRTTDKLDFSFSARNRVPSLCMFLQKFLFKALWTWELQSAASRNCKKELEGIKPDVFLISPNKEDLVYIHSYVLCFSNPEIGWFMLEKGIFYILPLLSTL